MAIVKFNYINKNKTNVDFNNKDEVKSFLKNNLNQISSFYTDNSNCTVVSGKELKENISDYLYEKEISEWYIEKAKSMHLLSLKTLRDDCYFIVANYKTDDVKLYSVYYKEEIKALVHDFLMETQILQWY